MDFRPSTASRIRHRKALHDVTASGAKNRMGSGTDRIAKEHLRNSKGFSRGFRVFRSGQKVGFDEEKGARKFLFCSEEMEKDRASTTVDCVVRWKQSRRGSEKNLSSVSGNAASCNAGRLRQSSSSGQEMVGGSFETGSSDYSNCLDRKGSVKGGAAARISISKLRFGDEKKGSLGKSVHWGESVDEEEDSHRSSGDMPKAVSSCIARRTRSRLQPGEKHQKIASPDCIDLVELQSSSSSSEDDERVSSPNHKDLNELHSSAPPSSSSTSSTDDEDDESGDDERASSPSHKDLDQLQSSASPSSSSTSSSSDDESGDEDDESSDDGASAGAEASCSFSCGSEGQIHGRKRRYGLDFFVSSDTEKDSSSGVNWSGGIGIAQRTRSHRPSVPETNLGTIRDPIDVDMESEALPQAADAVTTGGDVADAVASGGDGDDGGSGSMDDSYSVRRGRRRRNKKAKWWQLGKSTERKHGLEKEVGEKMGRNEKEKGQFGKSAEGKHGLEKEVGGKEEREGQEELPLGKSTKRKRVRAPKDDSLFQLLVNTIWETGEKLTEDLTPLKDKSPSKPAMTPKDEMPLPLKFSFGGEVSEPENKSELEKFEDKLWAEFDFVMKTNDIGSFSTSRVETEASDKPEFEADPSDLCCEGKHQFILDEEVGIKCRFCSFVKLEIKYILPSLARNPHGKAGTRGFANEENLSLLDRLRSQDKKDDYQCPFVLSEGTVWDIIPGVKKTMYPHQREGFEFMWKNLAGGINLEDLKKSVSPDGLGGCVISHAPGTGKSRLAIVFLQTFMEVFPKCRPLILAPRNMLLTWEKEFIKWNVDIPIHILNKKEFSGKEDSLAAQLGRNKRMNWIRLVKIFSWDKGGSILGMSYSLFERLVGKTYMHDKEGAEISKILTEKTGLLVLDEGHTPRNERSLIWKALEKVKTDRRIILSGTPFQNNFGELYNTLCLVRPKFADKFSPKTGKTSQNLEMLPDKQKVLLERRDGRGKWASLTNSIGKSMDDNLEKLRLMIYPFVHVHKGSILDSLPGLRDSIVVLNPLPLQKHILESFEKIFFEQHFQEEYNSSLVSVHPSLLMECSFPEKERPVIDNDLLEKLRFNPNEGVKARFVVELVRLSEAMNERVLVFSQFVEPLSFLKDHFKLLFNWTEGKEILLMDGSIAINRRQASLESFNDPTSEARVLLASTRACCEGISLVGASRVVLLDVVWNPSVERQAISRAYRLGQDKVVYTYHLITSGTKEGDKYYRQAEKDRLSELLFSSADAASRKQQNASKDFKDKILEEMVGHDALKTMFEKILYQPRKSSLVDALGPEALR